MIRKDSRFCDQNLQFVAILYKKFKILAFIFFNFFFFLFSSIFPKYFLLQYFIRPWLANDTKFIIFKILKKL